MNRVTYKHRVQGLAWYTRARCSAIMIAVRTGQPLSTVLGVIAALSPRQRWKANLNTARRFCADQTVRVGTGINRRKALAILAGADPLDVLRGNKVRAFYRALAGDTDAVCLDEWMLRALGWSQTHNSVPRGGTYERLANVVRVRAKRAAMTPRDYQAALWIAERGRAA